MQFEFSTDVTGTVERPAVLLTFTTHPTARPDVGRSDRAKSLVRSSATAAELAAKFGTLPAVVAYRSQAANIGGVRDRAARARGAAKQESQSLALLRRRRNVLEAAGLAGKDSLFGCNPDAIARAESAATQREAEANAAEQSVAVAEANLRTAHAAAAAAVGDAELREAIAPRSAAMARRFELLGQIEAAIVPLLGELVDLEHALRIPTTSDHARPAEVIRLAIGESPTAVPAKSATISEPISTEVRSAVSAPPA